MAEHGVRPTVQTFQAAGTELEIHFMIRGLIGSKPLAAGPVRAALRAETVFAGLPAGHLRLFFGS